MTQNEKNIPEIVDEIITELQSKTVYMLALTTSMRPEALKYFFDRAYKNIDKKELDIIFTPVSYIPSIRIRQRLEVLIQATTDEVEKIFGIESCTSIMWGFITCGYEFTILAKKGVSMDTIRMLQNVFMANIRNANITEYLILYVKEYSFGSEEISRLVGIHSQRILLDDMDEHFTFYDVHPNRPRSSQYDGIDYTMRFYDTTRCYYPSALVDELGDQNPFIEVRYSGDLVSVLTNFSREPLLLDVMGDLLRRYGMDNYKVLEDVLLHDKHGNIVPSITWMAFRRYASRIYKEIGGEEMEKSAIKLIERLDKTALGFNQYGSSEFINKLNTKVYERKRSTQEFIPIAISGFMDLDNLDATCDASSREELFKEIIDTPLAFVSLRGKIVVRSEYTEDIESQKKYHTVCWRLNNIVNQFLNWVLHWGHDGYGVKNSFTSDELVHAENILKYIGLNYRLRYYPEVYGKQLIEDKDSEQMIGQHYVLPEDIGLVYDVLMNESSRNKLTHSANVKLGVIVFLSGIKRISLPVAREKKDKLFDVMDGATILDIIAYQVNISTVNTESNTDDAHVTVKDVEDSITHIHRMIFEFIDVENGFISELEKTWYYDWSDQHSTLLNKEYVGIPMNQYHVKFLLRGLPFVPEYIATIALHRMRVRAFTDLFGKDVEEYYSTLKLIDNALYKVTEDKLYLKESWKESVANAKINLKRISK